MKNCTIKSLPIGLCCLLLGCTQYPSRALTEAAVLQQLETPTERQLTVLAAQIKHPLLKPIPFDIRDGLSPDEAAVLAVLRNPELRAARAHHGIANAQLLQAGLLPNPTFSYSFAALSGGLEQGKVTGLGLGLGWEVTSLITRPSKLAAATAEQQAVDLQIAWQEWQIAQAAKSAAYQLLAYAKQQPLLEEMAQRLDSNRARIQQAADVGLATEPDRVAAISAKNTVDARLQAMMLQKNQQQQRLNRALGLKPDETIPLQSGLTLTNTGAAPAYEQLTQNISDRRLDLMALQQAYKNQDEQVHIKILQQFPQISIGFAQTKNPSAYYTLGAGVSVTLPLFDQNQGQIALAVATRQQLFDEYTNRVFQAKADIAELLVNIASLNRQILTIDQGLPDLENLVNAEKQALDHGHIDMLSYYTSWNNVTDKKIERLSLQHQLVTARIALEIATGIYDLQG